MEILHNILSGISIIPLEINTFGKNLIDMKCLIKFQYPQGFECFFPLQINNNYLKVNNSSHQTLLLITDLAANPNSSLHY